MARRILFKDNSLVSSTSPLSGYKFVGYDGIDFSQKDSTGNISPIGGAGSVDILPNVNANVSDPTVSSYIVSEAGVYIDGLVENIVGNLRIFNRQLVGVTFSNLKSVGGILTCQNLPLISSLNFPSLEFTSKVEFNNLDNLENLDINGLKWCESINLYNFLSLTSLDLGLLQFGRIQINGLDICSSINLNSLIQSENISILNCTSLSSISLPQLTQAGTIYFSDAVIMTSLDFPSLIECDLFRISDSTLVDTVNLPQFQTGAVMIDSSAIVNLDLSSLVTSYGITLNQNSLLETFDISSLTTHDGINGSQFSIYDNDSITSIDLSGISNFSGQLNIQNNPVLSSIGATTTTALVPIFDQTWQVGGIGFYLTNNLFTQTEVDNILISADTSGLTSSLIDLTGNTAPSVSGSTAKTNLEAKGWTVNVD